VGCGSDGEVGVNGADSVGLHEASRSKSSPVTGLMRLATAAVPRHVSFDSGVPGWCRDVLELVRGAHCEMPILNERWSQPTAGMIEWQAMDSDGR
jgi:hypothetical protein